MDLLKRAAKIYRNTKLLCIDGYDCIIHYQSSSDSSAYFYYFLLYFYSFFSFLGLGVAMTLKYSYLAFYTILSTSFVWKMQVYSLGVYCIFL